MFSFAAPLALFGLLSLPLIYWLLQVTPPRPREIVFPPTKILRELKPDAQVQPNLRPYELQNADRERAPFRGPVVEVPVKPAPPPAKLEPAPRGVLAPPLEPAR